MVYIKEVGIVVADSTSGGPYLSVYGPDERGIGKKLYPDHQEAEKMLRGLLRWKLEQLGRRDTYAFSWFDNEYQAWLKDRSK